ncbi:septum formation protein Maf [Candidatus Roizmanbacteria bacterium]|nr:septum formation protein Maf [Candidatus Roizmanbacteria bacterium]
MKRIILASSSPRRKQILEMIGLSFEVDPSKIAEKMDAKIDHHLLAKQLSRQKARHVAEKYSNALVIAADTFIVCQNERLGKAHTAREIRRMLKKLSGRVHRVITGFTLIEKPSNKSLSDSVESQVSIKPLTDDDIEAYLKTKEPFEKAGGYAIQGYGALFVEKIAGDYFNIVGLPVYQLAKRLAEFGINVL